jgi:hypothetical protein
VNQLRDPASSSRPETGLQSLFQYRDAASGHCAALGLMHLNIAFQNNVAVGIRMVVSIFSGAVELFVSRGQW